MKVRTSLDRNGPTFTLVAESDEERNVLRVFWDVAVEKGLVANRAHGNDTGMTDVQICVDWRDPTPHKPSIFERIFGK